MFWINPDGFNEPPWDSNEIQKKMPTENHYPAFSMSQLRYRGHPRNTITDAQHFIDKEIWICVQNDEIIVSTESIQLPPWNAELDVIEHVGIIPRFFTLENDLPLYSGDTVKLLDTVSQVCWELKVAYNDTMMTKQKRRTLTDGKFDIWKKEMLDLGVAWMSFRVIEAKSILWNHSDRNYLRLVWEPEGVSHPNWYMSDISDAKGAKLDYEPLFPVFLNDIDLFMHRQILNWSHRDSETLLMGGLS